MNGGCPAQNTRKSATKVNNTGGLASPQVVEDNRGIVTEKVITPTPNNRGAAVKTPSKKGKLNPAKVSKIKERARRLSESDKHFTHSTPNKSKKKTSPGAHLSPRELKKLDIRQYISDKSVDSSTSKAMYSISEAITAANSTLNDQYTAGMQADMNARTNTDSSIGVNAIISPTHEYLAQHDQHGQQLQGLPGEVTPKTGTYEVDKEVTFKSGKLDQQPQGVQQEPSLDLPDFDNMTNADMMRLLFQTLHKHQADTRSTVQNALTQHKRELDQQLVGHTQKVSGLEQSITALGADCTRNYDSTTTEIKELKEQVKCLTRVVIKQGTLLEEKENRDESIDHRSMKNNILIYGLTEKKLENSLEIVNSFFKDKMKIEGAVQIHYAHRIGKGNSRPMLVHLKTPAEKGKIYKNVKLLKEARNESNKKYKVRDQLPGRMAANDARQRDLLWQNQRKTSTADQLQMSLNKGQLLINNTRYKSLSRYQQTVISC